MKINLYILLITLISGIVSCQSEEIEIDKKITSEDLNFSVSFDESFENTIYPSYILGLSSYSASQNKSFELLNYNITSPDRESDLKIKISESSLNHECIFQEYLTSVNQEIDYYPMITWNYENLKKFDQPGTVNLSFTCYIDNEEIDNKSLRLNYRSVNECVYGMIDNEGNYRDLSWMFAAYVNEDHPLIDQFLEEVLNQSDIIDSFVGYQSGTEESVIDQVFAIWYTLQSKGIKYSSITNTSNPSDKVLTQHVRFFDEVYNNAQANCVDGSVFLSSILKKIDIKPFLVLVPGHMYLGFYTTSDKSKYKLLETTAVGSVDLSEIYEDELYVYGLDKYKNYISQKTYDGYFEGIYMLEFVKLEISLNSFLKALTFNTDQWNSNLSKFNDAKNHQYQTIDIEDYRKLVQPIGS